MSFNCGLSNANTWHQLLAIKNEKMVSVQKMPISQALLLTISKASKPVKLRN